LAAIGFLPHHGHVLSLSDKLKPEQLECPDDPAEMVRVAQDQGRITHLDPR
jgi:hypothetical protein